MNHNIDLGKSFLFKILRKNVSEAADLTGSKSRISSVKRNIKRAASDSHNCIGCFFQKLTVSILTDRYGIPDFITSILCKWLVQKNLAAFFRYPSFICCEQIKIAADGFQMKNLPGIVLSTHNIRRVAALSQFHTVNIRYCFYITLSQSQGSLDLQIHQLCCFIISISGISHIRRRRLDPGKKCNAQCHDQKDRDKTCFTFPDLHPEIFV